MQTTIPACHYASLGDVAALKILADRTGYNFNDGDYDKRTPLHVACAFGKVEVVKYLLTQNVDVNAVDRWGSTPLSDGINNTEIKSLLLSRGAKAGKAVDSY